MNMILAVAAGGAIGSVARYLTVLWMGRLLGADYPWGTLSVNVVGGLCMGLLAGLGAHAWQLSPELRTFLMTGILGGFTTFSAFSLDVALLWERGETVAALAYAAASVLLSVGALFGGLWAARMVSA